MALGQLLKIPAVSDYIFDADFDAVVDEIVMKHKFPSERSEELLELINAVLDDVIAPTEMPALIEQAFGIDEASAKLVAADLLGKALLPLANFLPDIEAGIIQLGGKIENYPTTRIAKDRVNNLVILKESIAGLDFELTDVVIKRLLFLLQQFAKKEKTEEALRTYFSRSLNIGGLGLTEDQATALLGVTLPQAAGLLDDEKSAPLPVPIQVPSLPPVPVLSKAPLSLPKQEIEIATSHELAAEVPVISAPPSASPKESMTIPPVPAMPVPVVKAPEGMVEATKVSPLRAKLLAEVDIDPNELKAPAKQAAVARKLVENTQDVFATALVTAAEAATPVLKKHKISEKVFADLAGKAIRGLRDIYQTRDMVERDWELSGGDLTTLMQAVTAGVEVYQSSPASRQSSEAGKSGKMDRAQPKRDNGESPDELDKRFAKLTTSDTEAAVKPAHAELTVGSTALKTPEGQRKMVDIVSSSRLAGPIEQLGKMTPTEFRRLSSSAAEAGEKVEDLLTTLEATSYDERIKGVLAWRDSPMNQLYLQIAAEALTQGLALPEVSSRRRAAGKESLSPAEVKALALLNTKIRF